MQKNQADNGPVTVLYIMGKGRSGSTLLDTLLGQVTGIQSTGELWHLWEGVQGIYGCGCGARIRDCDLWKPVLDRVHAEVGWAMDPKFAHSVVSAGLGWIATPRNLGAAFLGLVPSRLKPFVELYSHLYRAIAAESGVRILVDSSKWPAHPSLLGMVPGISPVAIHLVRDPRGVANSWESSKPGGSPNEPDLPAHHPVQSSLSWSIRQVVAETTAAIRSDTIPFIRVRYEDFTSDPPATTNRILASTPARAGTGFKQVGQGAWRLATRPTHTVAGNPDRYKTGQVAIHQDRLWESELARGQRLAVELLTWPLRRRYGYLDQ